VVLTTTDSNAWGGASGHTYNFTRNPNGTTDIDVDVVRQGKNFKGWVLGLVLRTIGSGQSSSKLRNCADSGIRNTRRTCALSQGCDSMRMPGIKFCHAGLLIR